MPGYSEYLKSNDKKMGIILNAFKAREDILKTLS